jgi:hypothetical protein
MARETRAAWAGRITRWQRSRLTAAQFAAREGVNPRTLTFWKWKLGRDRASAGPRDPGGDGTVGFVDGNTKKPIIVSGWPTPRVAYEAATVEVLGGTLQ